MEERLDATGARAIPGDVLGQRPAAPAEVAMLGEDGLGVAPCSNEEEGENDGLLVIEVGLEVPRERIEAGGQLVAILSRVGLQHSRQVAFEARVIVLEPRPGALGQRGEGRWVHLLRRAAHLARLGGGARARAGGQWSLARSWSSR